MPAPQHREVTHDAPTQGNAAAAFGEAARRAPPVLGQRLPAGPHPRRDRRCIERGRLLRARRVHLPHDRLSLADCRQRRRGEPSGLVDRDARDHLLHGRSRLHRTPRELGEIPDAATAVRLAPRGAGGLSHELRLRRPVHDNHRPPVRSVVPLFHHGHAECDHHQDFAREDQDHARNRHDHRHRHRIRARRLQPVAAGRHSSPSRWRSCSSHFRYPPSSCGRVRRADDPRSPTPSLEPPTITRPESLCATPAEAAS